MRSLRWADNQLQYATVLCGRKYPSSYGIVHQKPETSNRGVSAMQCHRFGSIRVYGTTQHNLWFIVHVDTAAQSRATAYGVYTAAVALAVSELEQQHAAGTVAV